MEREIFAIKRLKNAGSENSRATKKLYKAARRMAALIEQMAPVGEKLPRGYHVWKIRSNLGSRLFLIKDFPGDYGEPAPHFGEPVPHVIDGIGGYLQREDRRSIWIPSQDRATVLQLAQDVADGLLGEIAEWLEKRAKESDEAASLLRTREKTF